MTLALRCLVLSWVIGLFVTRSTVIICVPRLNPVLGGTRRE